MIIRKLFKFEGSHIVRNCTSERCSRSIHGHSYLVEVFLEASRLDNAGMVMDFGLMNPFKEIVDMFDHTHLLWDKDDAEYRDFIKRVNQRWIELPCNPSAEMLSVVFHYIFQWIIDRTRFANKEGAIKVKAVRVHETATGYAESSWDDVQAFIGQNFSEWGWGDNMEMLPIEVSEELMTGTWRSVMYGVTFTNPMVKPQVEI